MIQRIGKTVQTLENDIKVQIDSSIRALEERQENQQNDIKEVQEAVVQWANANEEFQNEVNANIGREIEKINENFLTQNEDVDNKESRVQESLKLLNDEFRKAQVKIIELQSAQREVQLIPREVDQLTEKVHLNID